MNPPVDRVKDFSGPTRLTAGNMPQKIRALYTAMIYLWQSTYMRAVRVAFHAQGSMP